MKIAVISTVWHPLSHTDVIVSRWVKPYPTDAGFGWFQPSSCIASVYLAQVTERDIGRAFCARHGIPVHETIASALTLGGEELAVDAVLLIGEHGEYPRNAFGQKLYPRKAFFDAILEVFRQSGRAVPVFNDKHLSWDFTESGQMLAAAAEVGVPLFAGSSLPHCPLDPGPALVGGEGVTEAIALFRGDPEGYGFHSLDVLQSFVEVRRGGETGIRAVRALEGDEVRTAISSGEISRDLLCAALQREGYPKGGGILTMILERVEGVLAFQLEHRDGLRVTHLLMPKFVSGWTAAVRDAEGGIRACSVRSGSARDFFGNFACLCRCIEVFFRTGVPPHPIERTHLVGGALQDVLSAWKLSPGQWRDTPHLDVTYASEPSLC